MVTGGDRVLINPMRHNTIPYSCTHLFLLEDDGEMGIIVVKESVWNGKDRFGKLLLSDEARKAITHNGKYSIELIEEEAVE